MEGRDNISETGSSFNRVNSMSRPSGKSIYCQRRQYSEAVLKDQHEFQHRVEHLLTCHTDGKEIINADNCIDRLKIMDAQGQVWGQDMFLQVKDHKLLLTDIEAEEELDCYPLECIQDCAYILDSCIYNSILAITVKEINLRRTSILLFQCEQIGAALLKTKLEKAIREWRDERQNHDLLRSNLENMLYQQSKASGKGRPPGIPPGRKTSGLEHTPPPSQAPEQLLGQHPWKTGPVSMDHDADIEPRLDQWQQNSALVWDNPGLPPMIQDLDRDTEVLNHVLNDIEIFVGKLENATASLNDKKKKLKKKKNQDKVPSKPEFEDCFQKIKYGFNLLGKLEDTMQQPTAPEMVRLVFSTLSIVLANCPWANLASTVVSPLLSPAGIDLLKRSLNHKEQVIWRSLGAAWNLTRAEYPEGQSIPPYNPKFSDGWVLPMPTQRQSSVDSDKARNGMKNSFSERASDCPQLMQAIYEFHARNSKELTVTKGDLLEVLDQRKKWWLARNSAGEEGYIPNNILEPVDHKAFKGDNMEQISRSFPDLHPNSSPAEVTVWLRTKGFSKIAVKSLGVLNGQQLLSMSQEELKTVCQEEGHRISLMLAAVKASLQ
ncbi:epidermal growth factor receptor kinase substrate 8-like protein 3 [Pogona vitticeps]